MTFIEATCDGIALFVLRTLGTTTQVLLLKRAGGGFEGLWTPVAGTVEPGEEPNATAVRELREETQLELQDLIPSEIRIWRTHVKASERKYIGVFVGHVSTDAKVVLNYEHSEFRWASFPEAIEQLTLQEQKRVFAEIERVYVLGEPARELEYYVPQVSAD
jgi:8-oxo-dGTP pyrophosphatase MutT (NUDIX family)